MTKEELYLLLSTHFNCVFILIIIMNKQLGARPALIMSVSVRNSVCNTIMDDESPNSDSIASTSEMHMQRRLNMGQLGMPDAAAAILDNIYGYSQLRKLSTEQLFEKLHESLALETKYQPTLYLPEDSKVCHLSFTHK